MDGEGNAVARRRGAAGGDRPHRDRASRGVLAAVGHAQGAGLAAGGIRARVLDRAPRPGRRQHEMALRGRDLRYARSEEHTSELQSQSNLVCRLLLEKKNKKMFSVLSCVTFKTQIH